MSGGVEAAVVMGDGIERDILAFVAEQVAADPAGLRADEELVSSGRVDSLGLLQILAFVDERWHLDLLTVASPRDLTSVRAMAAAIRRETRTDRQAEGA